MEVLAPVRWLHILFAAVWIGGMAFNLFIVRPSMGAVGERDRPKLAISILKRFIPAVWASLFVVVVSGSYLMVVEVVPVGMIFGLKLTLVAVMTSIVAYIRYNRLPLLEGSHDTGRVLPGVVSLVRLNLALGVVVLLLSSFVGST